MDSTIKEYSEKIKKILANPQVVDKIFADMNAQNLPLHTPCLKLEVVGNEEAYELEIEDVRSVFNVFGEVQQVSVIPYGMALVMYKEIISAYLAQKILDGKNLLPFGANIKDNIPSNQKQNGISKQTKIQEEDEEEIKEDQAEEEEIKQLPTQIQGQIQQKSNNSKNKEIQKQQPLKKQTQSTNQNAQNQNSSNQTKSPSNNSAYQNQKQEYQVKNSSNQTQTEENGTGSRPSAKFTCRYEIQIANDKDFQVARRIIGPRGSNMKKVVDMCVRDMPTHYQAQDVIKLRLRGKGSGFKEGPNQQESNEPLHLCVSSKYHEKYMLACEQCELLIQQVYEDYKVYCKQKGLEVPNLQLKKQQNPNQTTQQQTSYLKNYEIGNNPDDQEIQAWIEARNEARRRCDFEEADRIRDMLKQKNIVLIDEKGARGKCITTWKIENR